MIFALNFEKSKLYPSYFEYDTLSRIKYIFPDLYLWPSTYSIYRITVSSHHPVNPRHSHNDHNGHHHHHSHHHRGDKMHHNNNPHPHPDDPHPPPTCHYPTTMPSIHDQEDRHNNRVETMSNHSNHTGIPSDIFEDQNDHHDADILSLRKRTLLFLCRFTFYLYILFDFCLRTSPYILLWITYCHYNHSPGYDWLFWVHISFLIAFSLFVIIHYLWLHKKYSDYFKPSAFFWSYTIKRYLLCHFVHPLRSILDLEPLMAFILRNVLFWIGTVIICNISVFGFIFQRPTLYNHARSVESSWPRMRRKVERNIRCESLLRYFGGFVLILLFVITHDEEEMDSILSSYFWGIWTFIYCVMAIYCFFIVNKLAASSLFRVDALWIMRVRKKGWLMSRMEEGLIWHRNYNKAQSFRIKRRQKQLRKRQRRKHRAKSRGKSRSDNDRRRRRHRDDDDSDSEMNRYHAHNVEMDVDGVGQIAERHERNAAQKIAERQERNQGRTAVANIPSDRHRHHSGHQQQPLQLQGQRSQHSQHSLHSQRSQSRKSGKESNVAMVPVDVVSDDVEAPLTMPAHIATDSTSHGLWRCVSLSLCFWCYLKFLHSMMWFVRF